MDEHQTSQSNSNDADVHAADDLSNSIIGKVKTHVSKILPSSLSKWLSPKLDTSTNRRRRRNELESDDEDNSLTTTPLSEATASLRTHNNNDASIVNSSPPYKRKKLLSPLSSSFSSYSQSTHRNIVSSTFIDDTPSNHILSSPLSGTVHLNGQDIHERPLERLTTNSRPSLAMPVRAYSSLNATESRTRTTVPATLSDPLTLGSLHRSEQDDDNSSDTHEKQSNPFAVNSDVSAVNFNAHLQKSKSLFSNKSYLSSSRSLSNYRLRRQPSSTTSLYRSTSSLCDNNSTSSTPPTFASPFYNGQTTFGGASSHSKRFRSAFNVDQQQPNQHRVHVPSKLIPSSLSKSTSSLNSVDNGTSGLSTTVQRILVIMNQSNTPLSELRQVSSALSASGVRKPLLIESEPNISGTEASDRFKRKILNKPGTPYNRPSGRHMDNSFTNELKVPSMSQLLQLKRNTIQVREIASKSSSVLNRREEYKLPLKVDTDDNAKRNSISNNNNIDPQSYTHVNKMRNNFTKRKTRTGKGNEEEELPPEPITLPNVQLQINKDVPITFSKTPIVPNTNDSTTIKPIITSTTTVPLLPTKSVTSFAWGTASAEFKESSRSVTTNLLSTEPTVPKVNSSIVAATVTTQPTKPLFSFGATAHAEKSIETDKGKGISAQTPKFTFGATAATSKSDGHDNSLTSPKPVFSFGVTVNTNETKTNNKDSSTSKEQTTMASLNPKGPTFSEPIFCKAINSDKGYSASFGSTSYTFSEPTYLTERASHDATTSAIPNAKSVDSTVKKASSIKGINDFKFQPVASSSINSNSSKTNETDCSFTSFSKPSIPIAAQSTLSSTGFDYANAFGVSSGKPASASPVAQSKTNANNKSAVNSIFSINTSNDKKEINESAANSEKSVIAPDDGFKRLAAAQKDGKWDCQSCLTRNDNSNKKCLACEAPKPNANVVSTKTVDEGFKTIADKQKSSTWECSSCMTRNDNSKLKCVCCEAPRDKVTTASPKSSEPQPAVDDLFKSIADKQKSASWECSGCMTKNDTSKTKCVCCEQSRDGTSTDSGLGISLNKTPSSQFSFGTLGSNAFSAKPTTSQFSFGNSSATTSSQFQFGSTPAKKSDVSAPASQFKFGSGFNTSATTSSTDTSSVAKTSTPVTSQFTFGNAAIPKAASSTIPSAPMDDVFKKIASEQASKWECKSCMIQNLSTVEKCACCEEPRHATAGSTKSNEIGTQNNFQFGKTSTQFSFGVQPSNESKETAVAAPMATTTLTNDAFATKPVTTFKFGGVSSTPSTVAPAPSSIFGLSTSTQLESASKTSGGFSFSFGTPNSNLGVTTTTNHTSKDVVDGTDAKTIQKEDVTILEDIIIKPATNGPEEKRPAFSFGTSKLSPATEKKMPNVPVFGTPATVPIENTSSLFGSSQSNTSNLFKAATIPTFGSPKLPSAASTSTPFSFGQSNAGLGSVAFGQKRPADTSPAPVVVPKSSFSSFGSPSNNTNATTNVAAVPPTFGSSSFSFSASASSTAQFGSSIAADKSVSPATAAAPVFGASGFSTVSNNSTSTVNPTLKPFFSAGSGLSAQTPPTFCNPTIANPSQTSYQFGANTNVDTPNSAPTPSNGPFVFSAATTPSFNFTANAVQQPIAAVPFQFGSSTESAATPNMNIFAPPPTGTTSNTNVATRRKLRPVRRNGRP